MEAAEDDGFRHQNQGVPLWSIYVKIFRGGTKGPDIMRIYARSTAMPLPNKALMKMILSVTTWWFQCEIY